MDKNLAISKLSSIIDQGKHLAAQGMQKLEHEYKIRKDFIVKPDTVEIEVLENGIIRPVLQDYGPLGLTKHSRGQLLSRAGVPVAFADKLLDYGKRDLLRTNMLELMPAISKEGIMFRAVEGVAKGILSSSYKRIDASPIFEAYIEGAVKHGLVPHMGMVTDTRAFMSFIATEIIELIENEFVVLGMELRSSDYGRGAVELCMSLLRLVCTNGMVGFDLLRKIHVGRRFNASEFEDAGPVIDISARTIDLDTATVKSALDDVMGGIPRYQAVLTEGLRKQVKEPIDLKSALASLRKQGLKKSLIESAKEMYESQEPTELLPQEPGKWRFANVIALLANNAVGDESKDLQDVAFNILMPEVKA